jgi:hypothetical protein
MTNDQLPTERASQLQEAIDTIVRTFDYPTDISIEYASEDGTKRTRFIVNITDEERTYELSYDGTDEETEPELIRLD